jgi:hypothetical protein
MIDQGTFDKIRAYILSGQLNREQRICGFYDIYIMYPSEPKHRKNKYGIEYRTKHAGEVRMLFRVLNKWILLKDKYFTYKDRQDLFECYCLVLDTWLYDTYTNEFSTEHILLELLEGFRSLMNEDIQTIRAYVNRHSI